MQATSVVNSVQAGCIVKCEAQKLSGTESRIANRTIPGIAGLESPEIPQRETKIESNRSKVESRKIDSESPSESHDSNHR